MKIFKSDSLLIGLAMFSMFFGAGNVIFPLSVGQFAGDKNFFAILGLILTAALMPIGGVMAMILFDGSYKNFFGRLGKVPGFILALVIISLLGPLGSTPRCIALAYSTLSAAFLNVSPIVFSAVACALIFLCTVKRQYIIHLLGWILTPALLISLMLIILIGIFSPSTAHSVDQTRWTIFLHGLKQGYNTMDLLAAFFFSSTILNSLRLRLNKKGGNPLSIALRASIIGALLLATIYIGFSYLAAFHAGEIALEGQDRLLAAIILKIAGAKAGFLVCFTVALACLTTAIALIAAFTEFFQKEVCKEKISYELTLGLALCVTFFVSTFQFNGISSFLGPILEICYPGLIVLTFLNIAFRLKKFEPIKIPVFGAFTFSLLLYLVEFA